MSANLNLVRSIITDCERGDYSSVDWADPEIEYVIVDGPVPGSWTGLDGMEEGERHVLRGWAELRVLADEYRELDDARVLVLTHGAGRGRTSGLDLAQMRSEGAILFHVIAAKVRKVIVYYDRDRALADLGLEA